MLKNKYLLLCILAILLKVNMYAEIPANLVRFNQLQSYTSSNAVMHFFIQRWGFYTQNQNIATGQSAEPFKFTLKPVVYPNPFEIDDIPRIQFAIPNSFANRMPTFEVRIYDPRGFELIKKVFKQNQTGYKVNFNIQEETYVNLEFYEKELKNKLSAGAYLYLILMNNEVVAKGKMAVKAYKRGI